MFSDRVLNNSRTVLEQNWRNHKDTEADQLRNKFPRTSSVLALKCFSFLMGNVGKRNSRELAADGARPLEEGSSGAGLHTQLYEAIMREDCSAIRALLQSHPINQPLTILASSTSSGVLRTQVPSLLLCHF